MDSDQLSKEALCFFKKLSYFFVKKNLATSKSHRSDPKCNGWLNQSHRLLVYMIAALKGSTYCEVTKDEKCATVNENRLLQSTCKLSSEVNNEFTDNSQRSSSSVTSHRDETLKELFSQFHMDSDSTPSEIISECRDLCARYLSGSWSDLTIENFKLKPIKGGMSNMLFLAELPENVLPQGNEPKVILLRIHCNVDLTHLLNESVIFTLLSERSLGPKLYGVFPGGRLEEFVPSRCLVCKELSIPSIERKVGALMARVHSLEIPMSKQPMILDVARSWLGKIRETNPKMSHIMRLKKVQCDLSKCPTSVTCDVLEKLLNVLDRCLTKCDSPVVFCHNDLQEGNILLHGDCEIDDNGNFKGKGAEEPLVIIDYEYANYNHRGFDFANHVIEHVLDYSNKAEPYYWIKMEQYPSINQQKKSFRRIFR